MNRKIIYASILAVALLSSFASGYIAAPTYNAHKNPSIQWNVVVLKDGVGIGEASGNVITDIGELWLADWIGSAGEANTTSRNATQYISVSNDASPVATWTVLAGEVAANGFTRATGTVATWTNSGDNAFNVTKTFTATGTQQLQCAGLHWSGVSASDNNLFACAAFTQTTFNADDTLTVKWSITVDAN